ncbi:hypothetical protein V6N11_001680 [Hibiscus sabdariffa]
MERSDQMFKVRAAELRKILVELGPAYIKIAQAVSSRPDLIPPSYLDELSLLQDRISAFSTEVALDTIEKELGLRIDELFSEISPEPVAAASLGQVYQARLRRSGQVVAVKVQRPGVQAAISLDILILRFLAGVVKKVGKFNTDLQAVVDEWASSLFREMDYKKEADNGLKFRRLYGGIKDVFVPNIYMEHTTRRVLVMEWVELSEVKDLYLVEVGVYCSFNQLLENGFYHADPHPGNLFRTYDGKLAYIDFGMMGEFKQEFRDGFIEACLHLVNRDFDALSKDCHSRASSTNCRKGARYKSFNRCLPRCDCQRSPKYKLWRPFRKFGNYYVQVQISNTFIFFSGYSQSCCIGGDRNNSPQLKSSLRSLLYKDGAFRIDRLESLLTESLRARTEKALIKSQREEADSRVVFKEILSFTLKEKGSFVREILVEEFAKGLDALGLATFDSLTSAATTVIPFTGSTSFSLMSKEDMINLRTLQRLMFLMAGPESNKKSFEETNGVSSPNNKQGAYLEESSLLSYQPELVSEILTMFSIIPELPPESQQQLLRLPADVAGRLVSRASARTIQRIFL